MQRLIKRYKIINLAAQSIDFAAKCYAACKNDIFYWLETFCWVHDPKKNPSQIPLKLYDFQRNLVSWIVDHIENKRDGLIEKSREMTVTWTMLLVMQWYWQFGEPGNDFLLGSEKGDNVYKTGDPRALFSKLRYNLVRQPRFLLPLGFDINKHYGYMKLINPETESAITGESNNLDFSRSGRYKAILYDEFAFWRYTDEQAWEAGSDTTNCRFAVSTANGKSNYFYRLRSKEIGDIDVLRLHWKLHPEKNQKWYEEQKKRRSPADLAREIDIDYSASVTNKVAENWNPEIHIREYKCNEYLPLELQCDFNIDPMCWSVAQTVKGETYTFREYTERTTITEKVIAKFCQDFKDHKNKTVYLYGDPAGSARNTRSLKSDWDIIKSVLRDNGWEYIYQVRKRYGIKERINALNKRLCDWEYGNKAWEFVDPSCTKLIESIEQSQRKDDGIDKSQNIEHHLDAWSYRIIHKHPIRKNQVESIARF